MKRPNYEQAIRNAVSWLGERYLLAQPVVRRPLQQPAYFVERPRWNEALPTNGMRGRVR